MTSIQKNDSRVVTHCVAYTTDGQRSALGTGCHPDSETDSVGLQEEQKLCGAATWPQYDEWTCDLPRL